MEGTKMYRNLVLLLAYLVLLAISGCQRTEEAFTPTPIPAAEVIIPGASYEQSTTPATPVATITLTPQLTKSPDVTPSVAQTTLPTSTATVEPTATRTSLPTLSPVEGETLLRSLLQTDENCPLPCWWGIHPGVTTWQEIEPFLESFASEMYRSSNPRSSLVSYELNFYFPNREAPTTSHWALYYIEEGTVSDIELNVSNSLNGSSTYSLRTVLGKYGAPEEVWIGTYDNTPSGVRPFRITLIYSGRGFVVSYETRNVRKEGEAIVGCPLEPLPLAFLWLTEEGSAITFEQARSATLHIGDDQLYLPLSEATDLTIEEFYQLFTETTGDNCLSTPAELWPY